jgi:hypothetical protein
MPLFNVRSPSEVPQPSKSPKSVQEYRRQYEDYVRTIADNVGELGLLPGDTIRSVKLRLRRAARRVGIDLEVWDAGERVYFRKRKKKAESWRPSAIRGSQDELTMYTHDPRGWDRPSPPGPHALIVVAGIGLVIGISLWMLAFNWLRANLDDLPVGIGNVGEAALFTCSATGSDGTLASDEEGSLRAACITPTPDPTSKPTPEPPSPTPTVGRTNESRASCDLIRGTAYRSGGERSWYLTNCVTPIP